RSCNSQQLVFEGFKFEHVDVRDATLRARHGGDGPPVSPARSSGPYRAERRWCRDGAPQTLETGTPTTNKPVLAVIGWSPYEAPWLQLVAICQAAAAGGSSSVGLSAEVLGPPAESCSARPRETKGGPTQCCTPVWISVASVSTSTCSTMRVRQSRSVHHHR